MSDRGLESGVELRQFVFGADGADLEAFDFDEPTLLLGLGDPVDQVVADLDQSVSLGGFGAEERASDASFSELWGRAVPKLLICSSLKPNR
ncbi:hypothetical protein ABZ468_46145 [Streptomyces sp. NPDC005708]|uniref:hypothetical protein n=1 Tax=Streptomyces sp. NPDC005708 TaxID=3154564 RepID=UPI0034080323